MKAALAGAVGVVAVGIVVAFAGVSGVRAPAKTGPTNPVWTEAKWPFPMDEWGVGKAFVCASSDCGTQISLKVRPKIGYCNCATGVADEAELERVSDNALVSRAPQPQGRGRAVKIGWMIGLSRAYVSAGTSKPAGLVSIAYNDECDVVVALATFSQADASAVEQAVVAFLGSRPMVLWAKAELGLEFVRRDW
jgi:hypothetical protein